MKTYSSATAFFNDFIKTNGRNVYHSHAGLCANVACQVSPKELVRFKRFIEDVYISSFYPVNKSAEDYEFSYNHYRGAALKRRLKLARRYLTWTKASKAQKVRAVKFDWNE